MNLPVCAGSGGNKQKQPAGSRSGERRIERNADEGMGRGGLRLRRS